ncbi:SDR family oxidoreductase [Thermodesulfobacteriota bacterium]
MSGIYLVLGAGGNLGRRVTVRLISDGHKVRGLVRSHHKAAMVERFGAEAGLFDLEDPDSLTPHLKGVTHIINTSYIFFAKNILKVVRNHSELRDGQVRLVFVGSTGVHTRLKSESAERKRIGERVILESGLPFTILRPTMIYGHARDGNISRLIRSFQKIPVFPVFGNGLAMMQPIYIGDVVGAVVNVMERSETRGKIYDIGGPEPMTYRDLLEKVSAASDKKIRFIHVPLWFTVGLVKVLLAFKVSPLSVEQVLRLTENKQVDNSRARKDFGFDPISFQEGLGLQLLDMERKDVPA